MKEPKTIPGYFTIIRMIERVGVSNLKGFDQLSENKKRALGLLAAGISNDLKDWYRS